jgi:virginiamycin B lyase
MFERLLLDLSYNVIFASYKRFKMRRLIVLAALLAVGCSSHSVAPTPQSFSGPQVLQKQPFKNPWLKTSVMVRAADVHQLTADTKGHIWAADAERSYLNRITMNQGVRDYPLSFTPDAIVFGSDGNLWVSSGTPRGIIARVSIFGIETDFAINQPDIKVDQMVEGPDGAVWFSALDNSGGAWLGRIDTVGNYKLLPELFVGSITPGPDGNVWFVDGANLYAINSQGQIVKQFPFTELDDNSVLGQDGNMWFSANDHISRITTQGQITRFDTPPGEGVASITSRNGVLWMVGNDTNGKQALISFDPDKQAWGAPIDSPYRIARILTGPDGNFWLTGMTGSVVTYVYQVLSVTPTSLNLKLGAATGGSGTLIASETNYGGSLSAPYPIPIVNVVQTSPGVFTVTAVARGTGKITIQDSMRNYTKIPVTVQ